LILTLEPIPNGGKPFNLTRASVILRALHTSLDGGHPKNSPFFKLLEWTVVNIISDKLNLHGLFRTESGYKTLLNFPAISCPISKERMLTLSFAA
jgi:hypothetical protein